MKKVLNTLLVAMAILLAFVACSPQNEVTDELVSATLTTTANTRSLVAEVDFDILKVAKWMYTAEKADNGLKTGATTTEVKLEDGKTELLSQGSWNFNLYGYDSSNNLLCSGSIENVTVTTAKHDVKITVKPSQTAEGTGILAISDDIVVVGNGITYSGTAYTMNVVVTKNADSSTVTLEHDDSKKLSTAKVNSGLYTVVVTFTGTANDGTSYSSATGTKYVNVYDNLTTTVSGTLDEKVNAAEISQKAGVIKASTEIKNVSVTNGKNASAVEVTVAASAVGTEKSTKVTFPASSISMGENSTLSLAIETTSYEASNSNSSYTIGTTTGTAVAGVTFDLSGSNTSAFSGGVEVETYIEPGLGEWSETNKFLSIKYVGEDTSETKPEIINYDNSTGLLKFKVYHFSTYAIYSSALVVDSEEALSKAIASASTDKKNATEIRLIKDIYLSTLLNIKEGKCVKIDLNGHTVSCAHKLFEIQNASVEFTGTGTLQETVEDGYSPIRVLGSGESNAENHTVITVGKDVTLKGFYGIQITYDSTTSGAHAYGVVINMYGKIISPTYDFHSCGGCGIYINGSIKDTEGNVPKIKFEGVEIEARETGIYGAGYAEWTITNCKITASEALSLKAGKFTIDGGTYNSNGAFFDPSTDTTNGSVETGASLSMTSNSSYANSLIVTVNKGEFTSKNGYAVYEGIPNATDGNGNLLKNEDGSTKKAATESYVKLTINGGTFTGNSEKGAIKLSTIKDANKGAVTGGTFSSDPSTYLVDGYKATAVDGSYKVESSAST